MEFLEKKKDYLTKGYKLVWFWMIDLKYIYIRTVVWKDNSKAIVVGEVTVTAQMWQSVVIWWIHQISHLVAWYAANSNTLKMNVIYFNSNVSIKFCHIK